MKKLSLSLATILILMGMVRAASGEVVITGYLKTGIEPVVIDSAYLKCPSESTWFLTADWHCDTMATDTFVFPPFADFPTIVRLAAKFNGASLLQEFNGPVRQVWLPFWDPHDPTQAMFDAPATGTPAISPPRDACRTSPSRSTTASQAGATPGGTANPTFMWSRPARRPAAAALPPAGAAPPP